ncbi:hypothetical protein [Brevundimonas sp.]|uniref:hypothetical protein n=1 Tax=Brevundimonas sp. TaxID=1871086 RepID=UPI002FC9070F
MSASVDGLSATERNVGERMSSKSSSNSGPNNGETPQGENPAAQPPVEGTTPDAAAGFQRGRIVWGRPPQPVFRAGPLPRDEGLARLMAMPPHPQAVKPTVKGSVATGSAAASGVAGGSNIPQAARTANPPQGAPRGGLTGLGGFSNVPQRPATPAPVGQTVTSPAEPAPARGLSGSLVPKAKPATPQAAPQITPQPEPIQPAPQEDIVVMSELEPVVAPRRPVAGVVTDASVQTKPVAMKPAPAWGKWAVAAGALVVAAGALFWWMNREPSAPTVPDVAPQMTAPEVAAPETPPVAPETVTPTTAAPQPVDVAPAPQQAAPQPARDVTAPRVQTPSRNQDRNLAPREVTPANPPVVAAPAPTQPAPIVVQPPVEAPVVEQGPPPTAAAPAQTNPDAPVVTRPQKLD